MIIIILKNMKNFLILVLLFCIIKQIAPQEISINPSLMLAPEIPLDYSIVNTFLYPASTKFVSTLPQDFYVNKLKDSKISRIEQPTVSQTKKEPSLPLIVFENIPKKVPIIQSQNNLPLIQQYYVIKIIYPFARIQQPKIVEKAIQIDANIVEKPTQATQLKIQVEPYKRVDNQNKVIEWKVKNVPQLTDYVVENGIQVPLSKTQTTSQQGTAQLSTEGIEVRIPVFPVFIPTEQSSDKKPVIFSPQAKPLGTDSKENKQFMLNQPQKPTSKTPGKQILEEIQKIRYKNHRWSIVIIILIMVILVIIFLFMKCWGRRNVSFWQDLNKKLDNYRNSSHVATDQQEIVMTTRSNELIQSELTED